MGSRRGWVVRLTVLAVAGVDLACLIAMLMNKSELVRA